MKYICLKCKTVRRKKLFEKTYSRKLQNGNIAKVPVCCGFKMAINPKVKK